MLSLFPLDVLDEIWDLIESVSEGFPAYFNVFDGINPWQLNILYPEMNNSSKIN